MGNVKARVKMYEMVHKQADAIAYVAGECKAQAIIANGMLRGSRVYLTGCGSSYHAALYGEHLLRSYGIDASAIHASDLLEYCNTGYKDNLVGNNATWLVLSHSWRTVTTLKAFGLLKMSNARCIALTSRKDTDATLTMKNSPMEDESDCVTLGYTTMLASLYLISNPASDLLSIGNSISRIIASLEVEMEHLAEKYSRCSRFIFLGAGIDTATALEAALKMKEGNFTDSEGMNLEQFLHGSISGIEEDDVVFIVASSRVNAYAKSRADEAIDALHAIGTNVIVVSDDPALLDKGDHAIELPESNMHEHPILAIVPLQLFTYHYALGKGVNPDNTREDDERYRKAYSILRLHSNQQDMLELG